MVEGPAWLAVWILVTLSQAQAETNQFLIEDRGYKKTETETSSLIARANNLLNYQLYDILRAQEGNLVMSSFSLSNALAMLSTGAMGNTLRSS